jgi:hypothetical protein
MAFSKLKSHLRRIGARTIDSLIQAIGDICELYSPDECLNCGFRRKPAGDSDLMSATIPI